MKDENYTKKHTINVNVFETEMKDDKDIQICVSNIKQGFQQLS